MRSNRTVVGFLFAFLSCLFKSSSLVVDMSSFLAVDVEEFPGTLWVTIGLLAPWPKFRCNSFAPEGPDEIEPSYVLSDPIIRSPSLLMLHQTLGNTIMALIIEQRRAVSPPVPQDAVQYCDGQRLLLSTARRR